MYLQNAYYINIPIIAFNSRKTGVCEYLERPGGAVSAPPMDFQFRGSQWSYKLWCILPSIYMTDYFLKVPFPCTRES